MSKYASYFTSDVYNHTQRRCLAKHDMIVSSSILITTLLVNFNDSSKHKNDYFFKAPSALILFSREPSSNSKLKWYRHRSSQSNPFTSPQQPIRDWKHLYLEFEFISLGNEICWLLSNEIFGLFLERYISYK